MGHRHKGCERSSPSSELNTCGCKIIETCGRQAKKEESLHSRQAKVTYNSRGQRRTVKTTSTNMRAADWGCEMCPAENRMVFLETFLDFAEKTRGKRVEGRWTNRKTGIFLCSRFPHCRNLFSLGPVFLLWILPKGGVGAAPLRGKHALHNLWHPHFFLPVLDFECLMPHELVRQGFQIAQKMPWDAICIMQCMCR